MLFYSGFVFCFLYSWFPNVDNNPYTNYNIDLGIINKPNHLYIPYGERLCCLPVSMDIYSLREKEKNNRCRMRGL